jgi:hypothetical protein
MRREALTLLLATVIGALSVAACDKPEQRVVVPELPKGPPNTKVDPSVPKVALGTPTAEERKESSQPVQGEVDTKEAPQRKDYEQRR